MTPNPMTPRSLNIPIGRIEFLGQVLHIVEHNGRLVAASTDESGMPYEALSAPRLGAAACRDLMRGAIDLLFQSAERSLAPSALTAARNCEQQNAPRSSAATANHCQKKRARAACARPDLRHPTSEP